MNALDTNNQSLLQQLDRYKEVAKGEITIRRNPDEIGDAQASFSDLMAQKVSAINTDQNTSSALMRAVDSGQSDDLVGAMVASQKASLSFSAMVQIRNRLVQAFDDVMKMPI
ncbi:flagellar hook-basal body complex protein FliE [Shewanella sp. OPT22]|nr:flagellar hook-basal body complex protein FliE [Shewanella sp. OPT22]